MILQHQRQGFRGIQTHVAKDSSPLHVDDHIRKASAAKTMALLSLHRRDCKLRHQEIDPSICQLLEARTIIRPFRQAFCLRSQPEPEMLGVAGL